ncbi:MAG: hypothetical protein V4586_08180 [Pseudomonadota bacterium]
MANTAAKQTGIGAQTQALLRLLSEMQALVQLMPGRVVLPVLPTTEADFDNMPV